MTGWYVVRDFYSMLQLPVTASDEDIRQALSAWRNQEQREEMAYILLSPGRRRIYDRAWHTASMIGRLRVELHLNAGQRWLSQYRDFTPKRKSDAPLLSQLQDFQSAKVRSAPKPDHDHSSPQRTLICVSALLIIMMVTTPWMKKTPAEPSSASTAGTEKPVPQNMPPLAEAKSPPPKTSSVAPAKVKNPRPLARPRTSVFTAAGKRVAPFTVRTAQGTDYFIRLVSHTAPSRAVLEAYIRGGETLNVKVPVGMYDLKYASGSHWFGKQALFGAETIYAKADDVFFFEKTSGGYAGYTIELILQRNGNLRTVGIAAQDF